MRWALAENDPEQWAKPACGVMGDMLALISLNDSTFKYHLDRYKYLQRFDLCDGQEHFRLACEYLAGLEQRLAQSAFLFGDTASLADAAVFPFVRQFAAVDTQAFESLGFVHVQQWLSDRVCDKRFLSIMGKRPVWQAGNALSLLLP